MTTLITHSGIFHADDVLCAALARKIFESIQIVRVFNAPENLDGKDIIIVDIGGGKYDHHQPDAAVRKDGKKRAACGLLFADYWDVIFPDEESAMAFERDFIIPIEDQDNGAARNPLSMAISAFNPEWDSKKSADECFLEAVDFMSTILEKQIARALSKARAVSIVEEAYQASEDKRLVVLPRFAPWQSVLAERETIYIIFPSLRGGYNLQAVPVEDGSFITKQPLPESWLKEKPTDCTFVHPGRFLAAFQTEEAAIEAAKALLSE